jgi:putative component of toxin-antitoxin plasmid stabilization module
MLLLRIIFIATTLVAIVMRCSGNKTEQDENLGSKKQKYCTPPHMIINIV